MNVDDLLDGLVALEGFNTRLKPLGLEFRVEASSKICDQGLHLEVAGNPVAKLLVERKSGPLDNESQDNLIGLVCEQLQVELMLRYELQNTLEELISKYEELTVLYESAETVATVMNLEEVSRLISGAGR